MKKRKQDNGHIELKKTYIDIDTGLNNGTIVTCAARHNICTRTSLPFKSGV